MAVRIELSRACHEDRQVRARMCAARTAAMTQPHRGSEIHSGGSDMPNQQRDQGRSDGGPDRSPSGPREANDPGDTRYGHRSGSGSNEPKHDERKEQAGRSTPQQGGDQTRDQGGADQG
jgi:hypothetical protein